MNKMIGSTELMVENSLCTEKYNIDFYLRKFILSNENVKTILNPQSALFF